jgi:hypothetical protein
LETRATVSLQAAGRVLRTRPTFPTQDGFALHWPLINADHMKYKLAQREFEKKKIEDSKKLLLEDPNFRNERELADISAFKKAATKMLTRPDRLVCDLWHSIVASVQVVCWSEVSGGRA